MLKLLKLMKSLWWQLIIVFIFVALQTILQLQLPGCTNEITAQLSQADPLLGPDMNFILMTGLKMLGISLLGFAAAIGQMVTNASLMANFGKILRSKLFKQVQNYSISNINKVGTSSLLTRINSDTRVLQTFIFMLTRTAIMAPTFMVVGTLKLLQINPMYTSIILIGMPIVLIVIVVTFKIASPLFSLVQEKLDYVTLLFREGLTGVRVVRAFNQEEREFRFFDKANRSMTDVNIKVGKIMEFVNPIISVIFNIAYVSVFIVGFMLFEQSGDATNKILFSQTIGAAGYVNSIMMSFLMLSFIFIMFPRSAASAKRILAALNLEPEIRNNVNALPITEIEDAGVVEFKNVLFTFSDNQHPTLSHISFTTKPGQVTAIIGSTGSGKSSLINLIPRFFDATDGQVLVNNIDVKDYQVNDLRTKIGFVPQQAVLFSGSVRDNLRFGKSDATDEEMIEALKVAQSWNFVKKKEGLDTMVSQGGKNFSGGQKQRLAIARALVRKPNIYIFDDSFSALDFKTDIKLRTALSNYAKNASVIIVAQRVSSIINAEQIVVLDEGKMMGIGTHAQLLSSCLVYQEIVKSQMDKDEIEKTMQIEKDVLAFEGGE
ncbi:MAG TPA: ABC transporter ATP-binding protein [Bacilli bacterium]|nr:ABC transporter ATP-binding protein [Bacilli bacterium]